MMKKVDRKADSKLKILLFDVETAPCRGYMWSLWKEAGSMSFVEADWYLLCWAAKWLGSKQVMSSGLTDFDGYKKSPENDKEVLQKLWKLLDEADIVIAHNGAQFDRCKVNSRFVANGIMPPAPYRIIDTLQVARKTFAFTSNRLNDLGEALRVGKKLDTGGFGLWKKCGSGDPKAWKKMVAYCKRDVLLLERVYLKLRPFMEQHPTVVMEPSDALCLKCGSDKIHYRGYGYTNLSKFRKYSCTACGGWGRERVNLLPKETRQLLGSNC